MLFVLIRLIGENGTFRPIRFECDDIYAAYLELKCKEVEFHPPPPKKKSFIVLLLILKTGQKIGFHQSKNISFTTKCVIDMQQVNN